MDIHFTVCRPSAPSQWSTEVSYHVNSVGASSGYRFDNVSVTLREETSPEPGSHSGRYMLNVAMTGCLVKVSPVCFSASPSYEFFLTVPASQPAFFFPWAVTENGGVTIYATP